MLSFPTKLAFWYSIMYIEKGSLCSICYKIKHKLKVLSTHYHIMLKIMNQYILYVCLWLLCLLSPSYSLFLYSPVPFFHIELVQFSKKSFRTWTASLKHHKCCMIGFQSPWMIFQFASQSFISMMSFGSLPQLTCNPSSPRLTNENGK